jgi:hypothetical protein
MDYKIIAGGNKINHSLAGEACLSTKLCELADPFSKKLSVSSPKFNTTSLEILSGTLFPIVYSFLTDSLLNKPQINIIKFVNNCLVDLHMIC